MIRTLYSILDTRCLMLPDVHRDSMLVASRCTSGLDTRRESSIRNPVSSIQNREASLSGKSLIELVIIVVFIGILAAIAVPRLNFSAITGQKAEALAGKIVTDLRRTRRLAISDAAVNPLGFALNMTGVEPYGGYEIENLQTSEIIDTHIIETDISCTGGGTFLFGPLGNLKVSSDTQLVISDSLKTLTITITPATGTVKCEEN